MFGAMLRGFRLAVWDTVTCSAGGDTRAQRGDTLSPTERVRYSISVGWMVGTGDRRRGARKARRDRPLQPAQVVRRAGGQGDHDQHTHARTRKDKVIPED
jgi:hypothetical protein